MLSVGAAGVAPKGDLLSVGAAGVVPKGVPPKADADVDAPPNGDDDPMEAFMPPNPNELPVAAVEDA